MGSIILNIIINVISSEINFNEEGELVLTTYKIMT